MGKGAKLPGEVGSTEYAPPPPPEELSPNLSLLFVPTTPRLHSAFIPIILQSCFLLLSSFPFNRPCLGRLVEEAVLCV